MQVHLAACVLDGGEPLGLEYLESALEEDGHEVVIHSFRDPSGFLRSARAVADASPPLAGVSMPSGAAAIHGVAFAHALRRLGYRGHLTAGGPFATLARARLLERVPGIDSVVRHDGEEPLTALACAIRSGRAPEHVPGVTTRAGDGPPCGPGRAFTSLVPTRAGFKRYAGVGAARIVATRGCARRCRYCGISAAGRSRLAEACEAGPDEPRPPLVRRRDVDHLAGEIAHLHREHGVRFFHMVDENPLPEGESAAVGFLDDLARALDSRGVRDRALSLMLRADAAMPAVVDAMRRLGVVRSLLGVESMTGAGLADLGRASTREANVAAMDRMTRAGILFHCNLLLVRPDSTMGDIRCEVAALDDVRGGLLDPFQVEIYEGTRYFDHLHRAGRTLGGPFVWHYEIEDPDAESFARLFRLVKVRVMGRIPLTTFAYDVLSAHAVARRLGLLGGRARVLDAEAARLVEDHNELWRAILRGSCDRHADPRPALEPLLDGWTREAARLTLRFDRFRARVERASTRPLTSDFSLPGSAAAVVLATALLGAGCSEDRIVGDADAGDVAAEEEVLDVPAEDVDDEACSLEDAQGESRAIEDAARIAGCNLPCTEVDVSYAFVLDDEGHVVDVELSDGSPVPEEARDCYVAAVAGQTFPCLDEFHVWVDCFMPLL